MRRRSGKTWCSILGLGGWLLASGALAETHPFTVHDLLAMERISDPQVSPDGRWVAFQVRTTDLEGNRGLTDVWLVDALGETEARRLTTAPASDSNARWAPDGASLFFLSGRSGSSQVWRLPIAGGEAQQVTHLPLDVASLVVAPDGRHIAFALEVFPECQDLACTVDKNAAGKTRKASGRVYDRLFVRHWDTWKEGRRSHLFVLPLGEDGSVAKDAVPRDLSAALDADVPSKPFGGPEEIAFTPDGQGIVFTARVEGSGESWSTNHDLYHVPLDGSAAPRKLTDNPAWDTGPQFSPDGKTLAWIAMERPGFEADRMRLVVRGWPEGTPRVVTQDWDRSIAGYSFAEDGRTVFAVAQDIGREPLFAIDLASGEVRKVVGDAVLGSPGVAGERIVVTREHLRSPVELYSVRADGSDLRQLTQRNREHLAAVRMGEPEQFSFKGGGGDIVHGFVVKPADFEPGRKYPVALLIHGGPQGSFNDNFHYRWNPQTYAGAGYGVVTIDFHGSTGYGQAFTDAIRGDWGGKPLEDLQKGLADALARNPWLDGDRVCALGASYGGFMINWIAGHWPDRFRCLVNHDGLFDVRMMYYATEELWFPEWEFGGPPWENPEGYRRYNPIEHVDKWKTPMLVIHGARDFRVPETQGFAAFTALQRRGIPSRLLYFPDENHWVLRPQNSILWHETVLAWLDRWLK